MYSEISLNSKDELLRSKFSNERKNQNTVKIEDTCQKLVNTLAMRSYESGSHVDYYDK